ncbi:MAG TPA: bromodomain-containing protein [Cyanobacteria bacterium UBA12227]|nr:bromodomain-containing protein [Cyanobacteria bacterium UBA12227]HAX87285.1 bromodomain-containing protein [Cyanobacteria bacterium UBA11370]HBY75917.1 bromodomain-containing protein [Cyanobacteria bacterium UBA11148]
MDFKYRWKNGTPPSRDQAAQESSLLDESQFETPEDYQMAENMARKHLNVPLQTADANIPPLPQAMPKEREDKVQ